MEAIKFELSICQKIFMCQLIIHLIFSMNSVSFNLFRSLQFRKLPIKNPAFILIPKQQIISLKFFLCSIPHPLFRRYCLVVIFQHLLADHVTDSVYDIEQVIAKSVFLLHALNYLQISCLTRSFDKVLCQLVQFNAFVLLLKGFVCTCSLNPLNFLKIVFAFGNYGPLYFLSCHDGVLVGVQIDNIIFNLSKK